MIYHGWKISFEAASNERVLRRYFCGVTIESPINEPYVYWCYDSRKWTSDLTSSTWYSTHCNEPKTFKSFLRHLRKHPELKLFNGAKVTFVSRIEGNNIIAEYIS